VQAVDLRLRRRERRLGGRRRVAVLTERRELAPGLLPALEQLRVRLHAVPAAQVGELVQLRLDLLQPPGLRLEREQERPQVRCRLAQLELGLPQDVARRGELRGEALDRRDRPLRGRDEIGGAVAVLGCEGVRRGGCRLDQLREMP